MKFYKVLSLTLLSVFSVLAVSCSDDDNEGGSGGGGGDSVDKIRPVHIKMKQMGEENTKDLWLTYHPIDTMRITSYKITETSREGNLVSTADYTIVYNENRFIEGLIEEAGGIRNEYTYMYAGNTEGTAIVKKKGEDIINVTTVDGKGIAYKFNPYPEDPLIDVIRYLYSKNNLSMVVYETKSGHSHDDHMGKDSLDSRITRELSISYNKNNGAFRSVSSVSSTKATPQWFLVTELSDFTYGQLYNNASAIKEKKYVMNDEGGIKVEERDLADYIYKSYVRNYPTGYESKFSEIEKSTYEIQYNVSQ